MALFKLTPDLYADEEDVESILPYKSKPILNLARKGRKDGTTLCLRKSYNLKTLLIMSNGTKYQCSLSADVYAGRIRKEFLITDNKAYIRKNGIEMLCKELRKADKERLKIAKQMNNYVCLSGEHKTKYYLFMKSGRVYGIKDFSVGLEEH